MSVATSGKGKAPFITRGGGGSSSGGAPSGAAGGDLAGTYPNPTLGTLTTKGDLLVRAAASNVRKGVGTDGQVLVADSTQTDGLRWASPSAAVMVTFATMLSTDAPAVNSVRSGGAGPDDVAGTHAWFDLTAYTQAAFVVNVNTAWSAGAKIAPQYSTDGGVNWAYLENSGTTFELAADATTSTLVQHTAYANIASAAKAAVDLRLVVYLNGAGVTAGRLRSAWLVLK